MPGVLPSVLRLLQIAPGDIVEPLNFIALAQLRGFAGLKTPTH
jgi:hypothetical protein